ncbi:MAG: tetratricopeptide repeat protein [Pirellulales bacterium]
MNAQQLAWIRSIVVATLVACGFFLLAVDAEEPLPPPGLPPAPGVEKTAKAGGQPYVERLLEGLSPRWQLLWDDRPLRDLRLRFHADANAARRRERPSKELRPSFGSLASGGVLPRHGSGLQDYRPELDRFDALMRMNRVSSTDFFLHGLIHYESGSFGIAARDFDQAIRLIPEPSADLLCMRGLARYGRGEIRAAWSDLDEAARRSPSSRNLNNRGAIECALGQTERGLQDISSALDLRSRDAGESRLEESLLSINRALAKSELGQLKEAQAELQSVVAKGASEPDVLAPCLLAGGLIARRLKDFPQSAAYYGILIQLKELDEFAIDGPPVPPELVKVFGEQPLPVFRVSQETLVEALVGRGLARHELNQIAPALADYSAAIRLDAQRAVAYVNRAVACLDQGDLPGAERDLQAALRLDPQDPFTWGNRGLLRIRRGEFLSGRVDLSRCLELRPELKLLVERISSRPPPKEAPRRPSPWSD